MICYESNHKSKRRLNRRTKDKHIEIKRVSNLEKIKRRFYKFAISQISLNTVLLITHIRYYLCRSLSKQSINFIIYLSFKQLVFNLKTYR